MRKIWIAAASILVMLTLSPPVLAGEDGDTHGGVVGRVRTIDPDRRTIRIAGDTYHVPPEVSGLESIERRDILRVRWVLEDSKRVVTSIQEFSQDR
jgi:hypothetical protein